MPAQLKTSSSANTNNSYLSTISALPSNNAPTNGVMPFLDFEENDAHQQLAELNMELNHVNRVREGAEDLLRNPQLGESLRLQVKSELDRAKNTIEVITKRMDLQASQTKLNGPYNSKRSESNGSTLAPTVNSAMDEFNGDDFPSALQHATNLLKLLVNPLPYQSTTSIPSTAISSSTISASINATTVNHVDTNRRQVEWMKKIIEILRRHLRVRYELDISEVIQAALSALSDKCTKQCRATAYRLIRHALVDTESVKKLDQVLDWYLLKTFHRDAKHAAEKEQAIKLIRAMIDIGTVRKEYPVTGDVGSVPISEPVMRSLVAVAEHVDDPFRPICMQTLIEILLIDIGLVTRTGGLRYLLHVLGEGPIEMASLAASAFLHIVDSPRTRAYLGIGMDLELALSPITDAYGKPSEHTERMRSSIKIIQQMLRSWSGLLYFCMDDMRALRSLVDTLRIPSLDTREVILDMFFAIFNIKLSGWYQTFIDGRRLTMYQKNREKVVAPPEPREKVSTGVHGQPSVRLIDQYYGLLIQVFARVGLLEALTALVEESTNGSNLTRKATLLIAEVLQLANRVLPSTVAANIQAVPRVFDMAADYQEGQNRIIGTNALTAMDSLNRNRSRLEPISQRTSRQRSNSVEDAVRRGQRQVEQAKLKMHMQMEDKTYQNLISDTQILNTKDFTRWSFEHLLELVEGPLLNPRRLDDGLRTSRYIRRIMSFYHPFNHRFSLLPRVRSNLRWIKLGCSMLTTLMSSPDGVKYLSNEDLLIPQIVKSFNQLDPFAGTPESDPIFSKKRVHETLTYGYLEMLGTLSKFREGIEIMEKHRLFNAFYHVSELKSRDDLIKGIVDNLDYSVDGHPRILLSKALTSSYMSIRLHATRHLGLLIRSAPTANAWTLRLLITQLYDPAPEVCEVAVHYLEEACESKDVLQLVVEMHPTMDHLGEIGHGLLLKFMSTPIGFRYLYDEGYIDREMDMWFHERNLYYVIQVEVFFSKAFNSGNLFEDEEDISDSNLPPHFYGEMAKTDLGCEILHNKGHLNEFSQFIKKHCDEIEDSDLIQKLKSILWAVGHVGSADGGLPFLEEEEIIPIILKIAQTSPLPSVRGTCFFVLGLIASTMEGAEILSDYRWEAGLTPLGMPTGLCVPLDIESFVCMQPWTQNVPDGYDNRILAPISEVEVEVITAIQNLANTVIANAASRSLARMKSKPEYKATFNSPTMFFRALHIISTNRYRLPVRRYIMELFNSIELNEETIVALKEAAAELKASATYKPPPETSRLSIFRRPRRPSQSDDSEEEDELGDDIPPMTKEQPAVKLRPVSRIIGFAM